MGCGINTMPYLPGKEEFLLKLRRYTDGVFHRHRASALAEARVLHDDCAGQRTTEGRPSDEATYSLRSSSWIV